MSASISPEGTFVTASDISPAYIWDYDGKLIRSFGNPGSAGNFFLGNLPLFSPTGDRILSASDDHSARIWDSRGREVAVLRGHKDRVLCGAFSPSGDLIVTGSGDRTARIWSASGAPAPFP